MAMTSRLSGFGLVSSWKAGVESIKDRVRVFGRRWGTRGAGVLAEAMEPRQMLSAVPSWVNTYGSTGVEGDNFSDNNIYDVATDAANNVYVAGMFRGTVDFDFGAGTQNLTSTYDVGDGYVAKYSAGGALIWIVQFAASGAPTSLTKSAGEALALDTAGNLYIAGSFSSSVTMDFGSGAKVLTSSGGRDAFIAKVSAEGELSGDIVQLKGAGNERITQFVGSQDSGITFLGTSTAGVDLDFGVKTANVGAATVGGVSFVSHYDASMNLVWYAATRGVGATGSSVFSSADIVPGTNTLIVTANANGAGELFANNFQLGTIAASTNGGEAFVASLNMTGDPVVNWGKTIASTGIVNVGPAVVDKEGNVYLGLNVTGKGDLDPGAGVVAIDSGATFEPAVVSLDSAGNYRWSAKTGDDSIGELRDMVVRPDPANANKSVLVSVGAFQGEAQFDPAGSAAGVRKSNNGAGFVWYLRADGTYMDAGGLYANPNGVGNSLTGNADVRTVAGVNGSDALVLGGVFTGTVDFDASTGTKLIGSVSNGNAVDVFFGTFVHKGTPDQENETVVLAPGVSVTGKGVGIANNDGTPGAADGTDLGSFIIGGTALTATFTVTNTGNAALKLSNFSFPFGFTLIDSLSTTIAPGASDTFKLSFSPTGAGVFSGNVSFTTNATGTETFSFTVKGTGVDPEAPIVLGPTFDDGVELTGLAHYMLSAYETGQGGSSTINPGSTKFDAAGNLYVTAQFIGKVDVDPSEGVLEFTSGPSTSNFLAKYSPTGALEWAKLIPTEHTGDFALYSSVLVAGFDDEGNVLLTGYFRNKTTFGFGEAGAVTLEAPADAANSFIARYSSEGALQFAKQIVSKDGTSTIFGGVVSGDGTRMAVTSTVNGGANVDLDPGTGTVMVGGAGVQLTVVTLYDTDGNYLTHVVGKPETGGSVQLRDVAFDANKNLYIAGTSSKTGALLNAAGTQLANLTNDPTLSRNAGIVIKLTNSTSAPTVTWTNFYKGESAGVSANIDVDPAGNVYVGLTYAGRLDLDPSATGKFFVETTGTGVTLPAVTMLDTSGKFKWGTTAAMTSGTTAGVVSDMNVVVYVNPADASDVQVLGLGRFVNNAAAGEVLNFDPAKSGSGKLNLDTKYQTGYVWRVSDNGAFLSVSGLYGEKTGGNAPSLNVSSWDVDDTRRVLAIGGSITGGGRLDLDPSEGTAYAGVTTEVPAGAFAGVYQIETGGIAPVDGANFHVTGNGVHIEVNDVTPATGDGTNFGTVNVGAAAVTRTFAVTNIGKVAVTLGDVKLPEGFTLTDGLVSTLAPGASDTFKVTMSTETKGTFQGDVSFESNMAGQSPFKFQIKGVVQEVTAPGIEVTFGGTVIADGDTTPSAEEGTTFAATKQGTTGPTATYTITNKGNGTLTITAMKPPSGFTLDGFTGTIAPGESETITVTLNTATAGVFNGGDLTITTNVAGKETFNFRLNGAVIADVPQADIVVGSPSGEVSNGSGVFAGTNFGNTSFVGSTQVVRTFTVTNTGAGVMKITGFTLPQGLTVVDPLMTTIAPGKSDTFSVAMTTTKVKVVAGEVSFNTNVAGDETFKFAVTGEVLPHKLAGGSFDLNSKSVAVDRTFYDELGNKVVFAITGAGTLTVDQSVGGNLLSLALSGTDSKTSVTVTVTKDATKTSSTGVTTIGSIDVTGGLSGFAGANVNVTDGFTAEGFVKSLMLNNVGSNEQGLLSFGGASTDKMTVTLGLVSEVTFKTTATVTSFKAVDWQDNTGEADVLSAFSLGSLTISGRTQTKTAAGVAGDLEADISLTQTAIVKTAPVITGITVAGGTTGQWALGVHKLGAATIKGDATGVWNVGGGTGSLSIAGNVNSLALISGQAVGTVTVKGTAIGLAVTTPADLGTLTVTGALVSGKLSVGGKAGALTFGEVDGGEIQVTGNILSFTSKGEVTDTSLESQNGIGAVVSANWLGGMIFAGKITSITTKGIAQTKTAAGVAGDFTGMLTVSGEGAASKSASIGTVSIAGEVRDAQWQVSGRMGAVTVGAADGLTLFVMSSINNAGDLASFTAKGSVNNSIVQVDGAIGAVSLVNWLGGSIAGTKMASLTTKDRAAAAGLPAIAGDFTGSLTVTGMGVAPTAMVLGATTIAGKVSASDWILAGKTGAITVGSVDGLNVEVMGDLASFTVKNVAQNVTVSASGAMGAVTAMAFDHLTLSAAKVASVTAKGQAASKTLPLVSGDFIGTVMVSGEGVLPTAAALGTVSIAGLMSGSNWSIAGNAGTVTVGAVVDSSFFVGLKAGASDFPGAKSDFVVVNSKTGGLATLAGFTVTGKAAAADAASFVNTKVAAGVLTLVSLKLVDTAEPEANGFAAGAKIVAYSRMTGLAKPNDVVKVANQTAAGVYDPNGGSGEAGYSLRIVE